METIFYKMEKYIQTSIKNRLTTKYDVFVNNVPKAAINPKWLMRRSTKLILI